MLDRAMARLGYVRADAPREYERIHNGADAIARGQRWEQFYQESGGLADMIAALRKAYFAKVGELKPGEEDALMLLATADRIAREIEAKVVSVIETGKIATASQAKIHARNITRV
jgi:hypothetical protein